jgi:hypothetical protein
MKAFTLCALLVPFAALADSPFDGTWVGREEAPTRDQKPYTFSLVNGVFDSQAAVPPFKVKADGTDQPVKGHAYYDTVAVKSDGPDSFTLTSKKAGKTMGESHFSVSADGKTLTQKWSDSSGTETATGETLFTRVGAAPKGAHATSGSWRVTKVQNTTANGRTITYKATADGMSFSAPTGQSYTAKFDGKEVPVAGDPGGGTVSLKKVSASSFIETDHLKGKVVEVDHWTVAPDGKTLKVDWERKDSGRKGSAVFDKQ